MGFSREDRAITDDRIDELVSDCRAATDSGVNGRRTHMPVPVNMDDVSVAPFKAGVGKIHSREATGNVGAWLPIVEYQLIVVPGPPCQFAGSWQCP
jgi:hypothetical protein